MACAACGGLGLAAVAMTGGEALPADAVAMPGADGNASVPGAGAVAKGGWAGDVLAGPLRSIQAAAATAASAARAIPINIGICEVVAPIAAFAMGVARNCMGSKGSGDATAVCARPSFANRSSATRTSSTGRAMLRASWATEVGSESSVNNFLWRTERPTTIASTIDSRSMRTRHPPR